MCQPLLSDLDWFSPPVSSLRRLLDVCLMISHFPNQPRRSRCFKLLWLYKTVYHWLPSLSLDRFRYCTFGQRGKCDTGLLKGSVHPKQKKNNTISQLHVMVHVQLTYTEILSYLTPLKMYFTENRSFQYQILKISACDLVFKAPKLCWK